jgi:hypothetical protein
VRRTLQLEMLAIASLIAIMFSTALRAEGRRERSAPTLPRGCIAREGRRIDEGLTSADVEAIEREVRLRYRQPIVSFEFARDPRSKAPDLRTVQVNLLEECRENSVNGTTVYLKRRGRGWHRDPHHLGRWSRFADYTY